MKTLLTRLIKKRLMLFPKKRPKKLKRLWTTKLLKSLTCRQRRTERTERANPDAMLLHRHQFQILH
jgi:hypothetical protein